MAFDLDAVPLNQHPDRWPAYRDAVQDWLAWLADTPPHLQTLGAAARIAPARARTWWFDHHRLDPTVPMPLAPWVDRGLLQRFGGAFVGDTAALRYGYRGKTSGSTGQPVELFMCPWAIGHYFAHLQWVLDALRIELPRSPTTLYLSVDTGAATFREPSPAPSGGALLRLDVPADTDFVALLGELRPSVLSLTPSTLWAVLDRLGDRTIPAPALVLSTAEALPEALRRAAAERLGCPVIDSWGVAEIGPLAVRCPLGGPDWHVPGGTVVLEAAPGGAAITTLRNRAMPLLRYLTGDAIEGLGLRTCPRCRHTGASFDVLHGRGSASLRDPHGAPRSPLPWLRVLMDERWPVARFQIAQARDGDITVRVLPAPDVDLDLDGLTDALADAHLSLRAARVVIEAPVRRGLKAPAVWVEEAVGG